MSFEIVSKPGRNGESPKPTTAEAPSLRKSRRERWAIYCSFETIHECCYQPRWYGLNPRIKSAILPFQRI